MPDVLKNSFFLSGFFESLLSTLLDHFPKALARESISTLSAMLNPPPDVKKRIKSIS
jgi:hypothetical protein